MNKNKMIEEIENFYKLYYDSDIQSIINKYKEQIIYESNNINEVKKHLSNIINFTEWNMTYPYKFYFEEKIEYSFINCMEDDDDFLVIYTNPFIFYKEDLRYSIEFAFSKKSSKLIYLIIN